MSLKDRLSAFSEHAGFSVAEGGGVVRAETVPCLLRDGIEGFCTVEKSFDPESGIPDERVGGAVHGVRVTTHEGSDGLVYEADGTPIGNNIGGDGEIWSNISIRKGSQSSPENDKSARDVVYRYTKHIVGAVAAAAATDTASLAMQGPFKIPNTFEARAAIGPVQDRIRNQRIAIIGLGGTGAYVLDLVAKTPVTEIHLLDSDGVDWHTFMRAPGAPTDDEVECRKKNGLDKVEYYRAKYSSLREGIRAHPIRVESSTWFAEFLSEHPVDYAFVCIDQRTDCDSPRQDQVYAALAETGVPFIDSGVSITLEDDSVCGAVTTSAYASGSLEWMDAIPNARVEGNAPGYQNVQLPEVNALAAALAVMEWRRRTGQYVSESTSFLHKFRMEKPRIVLAPERED
jgi:hypothetical protein